MDSLKERLAAFQRSRAGLFVRKVMDDRTPNLAALLAWGTLSAILPLLLGMLTVAGLVLRDPDRLNQVYNTVLVLLPSQASGPFSDALEGVRSTAAAPAGIIAILLLLFNGSSFFGNMAAVFDQAYHVESRNLIMQRIVAIVMLFITTALLVITTLSLGLGSLVQHVPLLPIGPALATAVTWSISILSTFLVFLLIYKVLPNAKQGWRQVLPGTLLSTVLFFVILAVFPLYVGLFPPNQAYAIFGVFLVFTFWLYLLGFVFVLGAELNAFLQEPARSAALSEATERAQRGRAAYDQQTAEVEAETTGRAPALRGGGPLGAPEKSPDAQMREQRGEAPGSAREAEGGDESAGNRPSLAGRILGFIGLLVAAMLLRRGRQEPSPSGGGWRAAPGEG
jgi:membrane protein